MQATTGGMTGTEKNKGKGFPNKEKQKQINP
jgi:hypothetical protein